MSHKPIQEWLPSRRWNPFNSYKLLAHVHRWKQIKRGRAIPAPILITVDPTNVCNFNCVWCNAEAIRSNRRGQLSEKILLDLVDFLPHWGEGNKKIEAGVKAICVAGGGEPLLNSATAPFIDKAASNGIEIGVVTNGVRIENNIDALSQCTWVGVSMDTANAETLNKLKNVSPEKNYFNRIISSIANLVDYSMRHNSKLGLKHQAYGVSYKYLLYKENIGQIFEATRIAKEIGCKNIHFRPASTTWDKIGTDKEITFSKDEMELFREQIAKAVELTDDTFGVYGVTHKFNSQFERANYFPKCYAIFMTAVIMPPSSKETPKDSFVLGLCCDRRGDEKLELLCDSTDVNEIAKAWGSNRHWKMYDAIDVVKECPRCTYGPHNEIYEQVILNDSMTYKFI